MRIRKWRWILIGSYSRLFFWPAYIIFGYATYVLIGGFAAYMSYGPSSFGPKAVWFMAASHWLHLLAASLVWICMALWFASYIMHRRHERGQDKRELEGLCLQCGYDLQAQIKEAKWREESPGVAIFRKTVRCPECGRVSHLSTFKPAT